METLVISIPEQKSTLVKMLLKELGVVINEKAKTPNKTTLASMKKTQKGEDLTKTTSHDDLMKKLNG
jgi:antitoxin component of RelBE/YafQ-DinJ toxin-antitoxin module